MADCIDLTSDGEGNAAAPGTRVTPLATTCITLISSEDETPAKPQQVEPRRTRPPRPLKKAYGDDFETDVKESQSQQGDALDFTSPKRTRKATNSLFEASPQSPDTAGALVPGEEDGSDNTPQPVRKKGRGRLTAAEKADREAEKERKKQERLQAREEKKKEKEADKLARQAEKEQQKLERRRETGKTALQDITIHLDPNLAKHRTGRAVMQKLEDTFGAPGGEGPGIELSHQLPMTPLRSATWTRLSHPACGAFAASQSQAEAPQLTSSASGGPQQRIPYTMLFFTAEEFVDRVAADHFQSVVDQAAAACPEDTLGILVEGLEHYLTQRERKEFKANGPGGGGFKRAPVDEFLGGMACRWPGTRHILVHDAVQAAEHVAGLTRTLAEQPFRVEAAYVSSFGAGKPDSSTMSELLRKAPLPHKDRECWFKALACIPDLGPQIAHAVSMTHPSLGALINTYRASQGTGHEEGMLQNLVRYGGSRVGPAGSKKIYQILTSDDPNLCIQNTRKS